jgi:coenzyme F420 hydrogenase subunit beta
MTAELADLSVGTVEGLAGWSTVLVRSARGQELLDRARGALEIEALADDYVPKLALASRQKKRRALERGAAGCYLKLAPELCDAIDGSGGAP